MTLSREEYERRASRTCKNCGKRLGELGVKDQRRLTCSARCGHDSRMKEKVVVLCLVCEKEVARYRHLVERFGGACCSRQCQRTWAGRSVAKWHLRLPVLYFCECGELSKNQQCRKCSRWERRLQTVAGQALKRFRPRSWNEVFNSMVGFHSKRVSTPRPEPKEQEGPRKWWIALKTAEKRSLASMTWRQKLSNMAGNQRQRMQRKSRAKDLKECDAHKTEDATTAARS